MDGGQHWCFNQAGVGQRQKVEVIVNEVKIGGAFEDFGDMQALCNLGIDGRVL